MVGVMLGGGNGLAVRVGGGKEATCIGRRVAVFSGRLVGVSVSVESGAEVAEGSNAGGSGCTKLHALTSNMAVRRTKVLRETTSISMNFTLILAFHFISPGIKFGAFGSLADGRVFRVMTTFFGW